jgi:phenylacetate-coenzyme A ligase PaaK-like adenylate-forming protein
VLAAREDCYARFAVLDKEDGLLRFLHHVRSTVPRYHNLRNRSASLRLDDFPLTSKRDISKAPEDYVSTTILPVFESKTSGTTGPPLTVRHDRASWYEDTYFAWARICSPELREGFQAREVALVTDKSHFPECITIIPDLQLSVFRLLTISSLLEAPEIAASVDVLHCRSSLLVRHISELAANGLKPRTVICGGEQLYDDQRSRIEQQWKCRTRSCYATSESGVISAECSEGTMHVNEHRVVEVLRNGQLHEWGRGELVVTNQFNWKMPFVRYCTGDRGELVFLNCRCGISGPCLKEMRGRDCDCCQRDEFEAISTIMLNLGVTDFSIHGDDGAINLVYSSGAISEAQIVSCVSRVCRSARRIDVTNAPVAYWVEKKSHRFICGQCTRLHAGIDR